MLKMRRRSSGCRHENLHKILWSPFLPQSLESYRLSFLRCCAQILPLSLMNQRFFVLIHSFFFFNQQATCHCMSLDCLPLTLANVFVIHLSLFLNKTSDPFT